MATYAIGDIQGCAAEFAALLKRLDFRPGSDRLWLVGDLVNRGPDNLGVLRKVRDLGDAAAVVLGNHDLHLLAVIFGGHSLRRSDTLQDVLDAPDRDELAGWLRRQPLLHDDARLGAVLVHAGIPPDWTLAQASERAAEAQAVYADPSHTLFFERMYGGEPNRWDDAEPGVERTRYVVNQLTRLRLLRPDGTADFDNKGALADAPAGYRPWYRVARAVPLGRRVVFGHWAALEGETGVDWAQAVDTGCVWGRTLTALNVESGERISVAAQ
ncbi:MAG: symmetrical bis(5'-nucleosyl)-tetraphosphatase [Pseudomonadota bacterium]